MGIVDVVTLIGKQVGNSGSQIPGCSVEEPVFRVQRLSEKNVQVTAECLTCRSLASCDFRMAISNDNPYAPPEALGSEALAEKNSLRGIVAQFRDECRALGGAAIFFSLMMGLIAFLMRDATGVRKNDLGWILFACVSVTLVIVGIGTLLKKMWAVRLFLLLNWLMALLSILLVVISGRVIVGQILLAGFFAVVFALAAAQCHRDLGWSRKIREAGYPFTVRLENIMDRSF